VALILGIYARLVTAISRFDVELGRLLAKRDWRTAWQRVDARFLLSLGTGIAVGIVSLATLMRYLLEHHHMQTMAAFFGLIVGSSVLVARRIRVPRRSGAGHLWVLGLAAAVLAFWLVGLPLLEMRDETVGLGYVLLCGAIAICAMILPGVSGAYFLLVLGLYYHVTDIIHRVTRFEANLRDWATIAVFATGCAAGLIGFSKVLRYLLTRFEMQTMAVLCGLMIGSLRKVWPFQTDMTPEREFKEKLFQNTWPADLTDVWVAGSLLLAAGAAVLILEYAANPATVRRSDIPARSLESPGE
jgi:putative membrane protein